MSQVKILIAGGGTVGLATAVFLSHHGVPSLVLERRAAPSVHPRALGVGPRSLEMFRQVGLSAEIDKAAVRSTVMWRTQAPTVAEIDRTVIPEMPKAFATTGVSPERPQGHYPQNRIDEVLLAAARERGVTVEFGAEAAGVEQDADGVTVTLADGRVITAAYLIGADGARSAVRTALGIGTSGAGEIGDLTMNILFDADLIGHFGAMPTMAMLTNEERPGVLLSVGDGRWVLHVGGPLTDEECLAAVHTALGADGIPVELVSVQSWRGTMRMADRFRSGRAFLVGDAARAITPLGAFGLNTGLGDAHNLAWKLAMVASGEAGDRLLDTYHDERHSVAEMVTRQAQLRWDNPNLHWDPTAVAERAAAGAWNMPLVTMGYRYDSPAVIDAVTELPSTEDIVACLDGAPGSRLPHHWLTGMEVSTLDHIGPGFVLFAGPEAVGWDTAGLRTVRLDREAASAVGLAPDGVSLVRPDGFVAWRSSGSADVGLLRKVLDTIVDR
jgi:2-polyprenyl-6-methoxyphenol hydroxylase-like FAD-dependent oxidoreductase